MGAKQEEKCLKKTNLLVYEKPHGEKEHRRGPHVDVVKPSFKIPICQPKAKQIRVCTGAEMKKMCPPKLCQCDKPRSRGGASGGLRSLLGFGLKAALTAAAWYVTYDMGIWGTSDDTHELYQNYCKLIRDPCDPPNPEKWEPVQCTAEKQFLQIPRFDRYGHCENPPVNLARKAYDLQNSWNHAVAFVFSGIAGFPFNVINMFKGTEQKQKQIEGEEQCIPYKELPEEEREEIIQNAYKKR